MTTRTITIDSLIAAYAQPIALSVDLDPSDYDQTADGLATLLREATTQLRPLDQTAGWLEDAAADLDALARLGGDNPETQKLLSRIDGALYDAKSELEMD
jgi:hypothetical protein